MEWNLTPGLLLRAYASGIFPMAESASDPEVHWVDPSRRGIFPLDSFHISRSTARAMRRMPYEPRFSTDFDATVRACAARNDTWINATIFDLYCALHERGYAHSQELWHEDRLVGGVYGVTLGQAFFGESMFSHVPNASKIALAFLVDRLKLTGFRLFDTQFLTAHLASLGAIEIDRDDYLKLLQKAVEAPADIMAFDADQSVASVLQRSGHTS